MRSRYSAFALGLGAYLFDTLDPAHPDRVGGAGELGSSRRSQRFLGLRILHAHEEGDRAEVLFHARLFQRGQDQSFAELSQFTRSEGRWRYRSGQLLPTEYLPAAPHELTRASFLEHLREVPADAD